MRETLLSLALGIIYSQVCKNRTPAIKMFFPFLWVCRTFYTADYTGSADQGETANDTTDGPGRLFSVSVLIRIMYVVVREFSSWLSAF